MMIIKEANSAKRLLDQFCVGYKNRDLKYLLNLFTQNATVLGSGIDEYRVGISEIKEQLERDWSQSEKGEILVNSYMPGNNDNLWTTAVCTAKVTIEGNEHTFEHLRGTIILGEEDGSWKIAHMHASFPDFRNPENNSFPVS
ncbi:nuclear transport factor 2 family protein [Legionella waltersii]|nr:nuclear transport factor 2 family protein [Legionella waltersii]